MKRRMKLTIRFGPTAVKHTRSPQLKLQKMAHTFTHPLANWAGKQPHTTVALWVGVRNAGDRTMTFLPSIRSSGDFIADIDPPYVTPDGKLSLTGELIIGVTFDKDLPSKRVVKIFGDIVSFNSTFLEVEVEVTDAEAGALTGMLEYVDATVAPELNDPDERPAPAAKAKAEAAAPQLLSESQTIFAKLAEYKLMDNSHLPVRVVADVTNCPDFATFQTALDKAGFTLRFAPKDSAAANLSAMSESDVLALLKRIPSDTLARELTNRGLEVIG